MRHKVYSIPVPPIAWQKVVRSGSRSYDNQARDKVSFGLYLAQQHNEEPLFTNPIHMHITFYMPIPKQAKEKPKYKHHSTSPYIDSLLKFFLEAIQDIIVVDDRVICSLTVKKMYDKEPRTEIVITEVD